MKHTSLILEYSQITTYIYIGTNMCCESDFARSLLKKGIKADISLEEGKVDQPFGVDYFLWLPTKDHTSPTLKQLEVGTDFIKNLVHQRIKIYVHCRQGHGRAPTLVAAYLAREGMDVEKAFHCIKKKRQAIHPNRKQIVAVKKFIKKI